MSGIGWYGDLGNIQIMPIVGETDLRSGSNEEMPLTKGKNGWKSHFSHKKEKAEAGYYSVYLDKYNVIAESTSSCHGGILKLTYPESKESGLIFNFSRRIAGHADYEKIEIIDDIETVVDITRKLCYKFTQDTNYIETEISNHAKNTILLRLKPEYVCGKTVKEE
jgi:putative alpha-1,2-mannosidase